jgi:cytochrome o ubiquinol oxidase subunit 2
VLVALCVASGTALVLYLHGVSVPVWQPAGPVALQEKQVMVTTLLLCSIVVVPVFVLLFLFAWRYRASNPRNWAHHRPNWDHVSPLVEFTWWLVPTAIICALSVVAWQSTHELDPFNPIASTVPPLEVQVVALDWKWLFVYPTLGIASVNMLEMPTDVPVHFSLTADAPMNSFWIPSLGGQIMVMPGMTTQLSLLASKEGSFDGFSANISGKGFAGMSFTARAVSAEEFYRWAQVVRQEQHPLTLTAYDALAAPSENVTPVQYSEVAPDLYTSVIHKFMMPSNMPMNVTIPANMPMPMNNPAMQ